MDPLTPCAYHNDNQQDVDDALVAEEQLVLLDEVVYDLGQAIMHVVPGSTPQKLKPAGQATQRTSAPAFPEVCRLTTTTTAAGLQGGRNPCAGQSGRHAHPGCDGPSTDVFDLLITMDSSTSRTTIASSPLLVMG